MRQARTLKLEWGGGVLVPNRWTIMEQEIYILLKLIDNQHHTQHELHTAKLKLSTEWIPVQVYEDRTEQSNPYTLSRSINVSE